MTVAVEVFALRNFFAEGGVGEGEADGFSNAAFAGGPGKVDHVGVAFAVFLAVAEVDGGEGERSGFENSGGGVSDEEGGLREQLPEFLLGNRHGKGSPGFLVSAKDSSVARVVIGADGPEGSVRQSAEKKFGSLFFKGIFSRGRMKEDKDGWLRGMADTVRSEKGGNAVEGGGADAVDGVRIFTHLLDAFGGEFCGGEMEMGDFGDGMADLFVPLGGGGFAAVEVGEGDLAGERGVGGGEDFKAVAQDHDQVGF